MPRGRKKEPKGTDTLGKTPEIIHEVPAMPKGLTKRHSNEWQRVCQMLIDLDRLTLADVDAVQAYVIAREEYAQACGLIRREGMLVPHRLGHKVRNPAFDVRKQAERVMHDFARDFGLTPNARRKLGGTQGTKPDELSDFLGSRSKLPPPAANS
jgi:P27 family predicted phage terminase small subunit